MLATTSRLFLNASRRAAVPQSRMYALDAAGRSTITLKAVKVRPGATLRVLPGI